MKSPLPQVALLVLVLLLFSSAAREANAQTSPVTLHFDNLPSGTMVLDQYRPYATFSTLRFSGGYNNTYYGPNPFAYANNVAPGGSYPNGLITTHPTATTPGNFNLYVDFLIPVNNLKFKLLNSVATYRLCYVDIYVDHNYYTTYQYFGNGTRSPILADLSSIPRVTGIVTYSVSNGRYVNFYPYTVWQEEFVIYDDFTFTPDLTVNITNPRVGGNLQGTVRKALLGADVRLQAAANRSGGTYSWSFTGGNRQHVSTSADQTATLGRWTEPGTYKATVSYTLNGVTVSSSVDVEVIVPTLTDFTADTQDPEDIFIGDCARGIPVVTPTAYQLGCSDFEVERGIFFTAAAQIPSGEYLSDPAQSGIKFKQGISTFRKRMNAGSVECYTKRTSDADVASGWQLDTSETYNHNAHPPVYFSQGNTQISMRDYDTPGTALAGKNIVELVPFMYDAVFVDDRFEMYVYYFTGPNPDSPNFQRPLKLANSSLPVARVAWNWGGQVVFDSSAAGTKYRKQSSSTILGFKPPGGTNAVVPLQTNFRDNEWGRCPGGPPPTTNPIDGSRFFVDQHYLDFLNRASDQSGSDFWTSNITQCGFDTACISGKRVDVSRAFFYSGEYVALHPELGGQRGTHEYNAAFVLQCYRGFLRREPNAPPDNNWVGFNYWVDKLDSTNPDAGDWKYNEMLKAFIESIEYRGRFVQ